MHFFLDIYSCTLSKILSLIMESNGFLRVSQNEHLQPSKTDILRNISANGLRPFDACLTLQSLDVHPSRWGLGQGSLGAPFTCV